MTRQIAQDGATGDDDGFDLSRMTAREVAAELVRRHQALQTRPGIGNSARMMDAASVAAQPTAVQAVSDIYSAPEPVQADPAGDGFWHLDRSLHVPPSMPMLAARNAFGAIAKLEAAAHHSQAMPVAQGRSVAKSELTDEHGELANRDRPIRYDPLDQPVEPFMPTSVVAEDLARQRDPTTVMPSTGKVLLPERNAAKFGTGFAWGMLVGAMTMVILLAVEIAVYPSLHLPARLHQLRALITSGAAADGDALPVRSAAATLPAAANTQVPAPAPSSIREISRPQPVLLLQGPKEATLVVTPASAAAVASPAPAAEPVAPVPLAATVISSTTDPGAVETDHPKAINGTSPAASATAKAKSKAPVAKATSVSQQQIKSVPARAKAIAALLEGQLSGAKR